MKRKSFSKKTNQAFRYFRERLPLLFFLLLLAGAFLTAPERLETETRPSELSEPETFRLKPAPDGLFPICRSNPIGIVRTIRRTNSRLSVQTNGTKHTPKLDREKLLPLQTIPEADRASIHFTSVEKVILSAQPSRAGPFPFC